MLRGGSFTGDGRVGEVAIACIEAQAFGAAFTGN